ncbi:MAG: hypothetical protein GC191_06535 [Azospirillum sp.]|nr:hypothetical protein [Azospirillum sp.]
MAWFFGVVIVAPLWGMLSTQIFSQSWLSFINFVICVIGAILGKVPRRQNLIGMGVSICSTLLFSALLGAGFWILTEKMSFGYTWSENIVYWIFCVLSAAYMIPKIVGKIRKSWREATIPGALAMSVMERCLNSGGSA